MMWQPSPNDLTTKAQNVSFGTLSFGLSILYTIFFFKYNLIIGFG